MSPKSDQHQYAYLYIAKDIEICSNNRKLSFSFNNGSPRYQITTETNNQIGTKVRLIEANESLKSLLFAKKELNRQFALEFCWLLKQNSQLQIKINGEEISCLENIKDSVILRRQDFSAEVQFQLDDSFFVELILWKEKPAEYSYFYFLDKDRNEILKSGTGLNKKSDDFWHSVYVISDLFEDGDEKPEVENQQLLNIEQKKKNKLKSQIKKGFIWEMSEFRGKDLIFRDEIKWKF